MSKSIRTWSAIAFATLGLSGCVGVPTGGPPPAAYEQRPYEGQPRAEPVAIRRELLGWSLSLHPARGSATRLALRLSGLGRALLRQRTVTRA